MSEQLGPRSPRSHRAQLRHATFIDPQTATKSKRAFSLTPELHNSAINGQHDDDDDDTPTHLYGAGRHENELAWRRGAKPRWIKLKRWAGKVKAFATSDTGKGIFKCALAYLLGSLATFVPALSNLFGREDSKHLVATITVYFHPARSLGSMLDAVLLACAAFIYTTFVAVVSMSVSVLFTDVFNLVALGHTLVLILFVGGGLGFIGWVKLKKGDPLVNIACSLTSLSLITILTKEGAVQAGNYSFHKIVQILEMILAGVMSTTLVSFLVFPISGRLKLKENMVEVTDSLSDMLGLITKSFISGEEQELADQRFVTVSDRHKQSSSRIAQTLKESKFEHYFLGTEKTAAAEANVASCLHRIAQSIGGLRSAAAMQFVVVKQPISFADLQDPNGSVAYRNITIPPSNPGSGHNQNQTANLKSSVYPFAEHSTTQTQNVNSTAEAQSSQTRRWRSPQEIFELFIDHLGPSMRSLAYTMKEILDELPFDPDDNYMVLSHPRFEMALDRALALYKETRKNALKVVYDKKDLDRNRPFTVEADWEEAAACCGHFSFSLLEVAEQLREFLQSLDELQIEIDTNQTVRSWSWMRFWKRAERHRDQHEHAQILQERDDNNLKVNMPEPRDRSYDESTWQDGKPAWKRKLFRKVYDMMAVLRQEDNKFGIKVGFGAMLYALPSFVSATRPIYSHWRGEWGLLSYMLVCSMTIGASNTTGYQRFLGTGLGAVLALIAWEISGQNPLVLGFFGFCMAYWTAWIIIGKGKGPMGRFIMLTYNLSALYAYTLAVADDLDDDDEEDASKSPLIFEITSHRVVAVLTGCIWGLIITRAVWPISARRKLKDGLSLLWLRMGLIWKRDPLSVFTEGEHPDYYMNLREEYELQRFLSKLQSLVESSKHEFELRRPFPHDAYNRILRSTGRMLEAFHTMNVVIQKDLSTTSGELALLQATNQERSALCTRISHQFGVLASSMKLEFSMATDVLPKTDNSRDRLLARMFQYRKEDIDRENTTDEDYSLLYTYALVTGQIGREIQNVLKEVEALFGVLDEESLWLQ